MSFPEVAPTLPGVIAGWHVAEEGYAQPTTAGGGYVEIVGDVVSVAYETNSAEQEMGLDAFLVTRVPVEVLRAVVDCHDAASVPPASLEQLHQAAREMARGLFVASLKERTGESKPDDIAEIATALSSMALAARQLARSAGR